MSFTSRERCGIGGDKPGTFCLCDMLDMKEDEVAILRALQKKALTLREEQVSVKAKKKKKVE